MKMKRIAFLLSLLLLFAYVTTAGPAFPRKIPVIVAGDTIFITLRGDEYCKYATEENGFSLLQTEAGWRYAMVDVSGKVVASDYTPEKPGKASAALRQFLSKQQKNLMPDAAEARQRRRQARYKERPAVKRPVLGRRKALVILMQFSDVRFSKGKSDFERLFNEKNYRDDGAVGSVRDYYDYASYGRLDLQSDIIGPYTAAHPMAYYGGNSGAGSGDKNPYALFEEAINHALGDVELSEYDADGDGFVDNIHIIYAGYGEEAGASANAIWAHEMTFRPVSLQGMDIDRYSCAPELRGNAGKGISRIGPHCHEIGHALGAMDYYDTDYASGGNYQGTGNWDIMASGSWNNDGISPANFNPYVKLYDFGWTNEKFLQDKEENVIRPNSETADVYRINTGTDDDFYLLENRQQTGFDQFVPGRGLLIFHVGPQLGNKSYSNTINNTYPQQCYPVCASSASRRPSSNATSYGDINSEGCPYPGSRHNTEFSDLSTPAAFTVGGKSTGIRLTDIREDNENIILYCDSGGDKPSGNPDTSGKDDATIWHEDFETLSLSSFWTYENVDGRAAINIKIKMMGTDSPKSPYAANGQGLAEFLPETGGLLQRNSVCGLLKGGSIVLDASSKHTFQLKVRRYAISGQAHDSLQINIRYGDGEEQVQAVEVLRQDEWETIEIPMLPAKESCEPSFRIMANSSSVLFLDDMRIMNDSQRTGITPIYQRKSVPETIYDLQGRKVRHMGHSGLYVVNGRIVLAR